MTTSEVAALEDLRVRLDRLQRDVRRLESYGCATLKALALLPPKVGEALLATLKPPLADAAADPRQGELFPAALEVQALARRDGLASALEAALVQAAAELDETSAA